jgi:hypothetical protein
VSIPTLLPESQQLPHEAPAQEITVYALPPGADAAVSQLIDCGVIGHPFTALRVIIILQVPSVQPGSQGILMVPIKGTVAEPPVPQAVEEQSSNVQEMSTLPLHPSKF